jgi:hypothetical protein
MLIVVFSAVIIFSAVIARLKSHPAEQEMRISRAAAALLSLKTRCYRGSNTKKEGRNA